MSLNHDFNLICIVTAIMSHRTLTLPCTSKYKTFLAYNKKKFNVENLLRVQRREKEFLLHRKLQYCMTKEVFAKSKPLYYSSKDNTLQKKCTFGALKECINTYMLSAFFYGVLRMM